MQEFSLRQLIFKSQLSRLIPASREQACFDSQALIYSCKESIPAPFVVLSEESWSTL